MKAKLKEYFRGLSEYEKVNAIQKQSKVVRDSFEKKHRALLAESSFNGSRTGARGGKRTTLTARASNACKNYQDAIDILKIYVNELP